MPTTWGVFVGDASIHIVYNLLSHFYLMSVTFIVGGFCYN